MNRTEIENAVREAVEKNTAAAKRMSETEKKK